MKFSDQTLSILKNFAEINPGVLFRPGNIIKTMAPSKSLMAVAKVEEDIPTLAALHNLSQFLATLSLFESPDVEFQEKKFVISGGKSKIYYTYASENMIIAPPQKDLQMPAEFAKVSLKWDDIIRVKKAAAVLQVPEIAFTGNGTTISFVALNSEDKHSNKFDIEVGEYSGSPFNKFLLAENLKLLPNDYEATLANDLVHFASPNVEYYAAFLQKK